jgi:parallel beta-helix repeat protein
MENGGDPSSNLGGGMKKSKMKKQYRLMGFFLIAVIIILFYYFAIYQNKPTLIYQCQEINKSGNYELAQDLTPINNCLEIKTDNVAIDGKGHQIIGKQKANNYGIHIISSKEIIIKNFIIKNYEQGIFIEDSQNVKVINNTILESLQSIFLLNSKNSQVLSNEIEKSSNIGITLSESSENDIQNNEVKYSLFPIVLDGGTDNLVKLNSYNDNLNPTIKIVRNTSIINQNKRLNFTIDLGQASNCLNCNFDLILNPHENDFSFTRQGNQIQGSFTPTKKGIYSLQTKLTDSKENIETIKYIYLVSPEKTTEEDYYIRGIDPLHGQAESWGIYKADSGSLISQRPINDEIRNCTDWVQFSPDSLPEYLLGVVKEINFSLNYSQNAENSSIGIERFSTYDSFKLSKNISINNTQDKFVSNNFSFNVNWVMNYFWEWYWQSIKLTTINGNPQVKISPENPDIAKIVYIYSSTPAIRYIDNEKVLILSATMSSSDEASIILGGRGNTNFSIEMPNKIKNYKVEYNGDNCNDYNCKINDQYNGIISLSLNIQNQTNLEIFPIE